jgi:hypothetical protein
MENATSANKQLLSLNTGTEKRKQSKKLKREILQSMRSKLEVKWIAPAAMASALTSSVQSTDIVALITPGTTSSQRIGDAIRLTKLRLSCNGIVGDATNIIRCTIFKWLPSTTTDVPSASEVYQDSSTGPRLVLSPFVPNQPSRFKILFDSLMNLDGLAHPQVLLQKELKLNFTSGFDQGGNTGMNHLFLWFVSDSNVTPHPSISWEATVYYTDD